MKNTVKNIIAVLFILTGIAIICYPLISNWLFEKNGSKIIQSYDNKMEELTRSELERQRELAIEYNQMLTGMKVRDPFVPNSGSALPENYTSILNIDGVIGYIEIPVIDVTLPIYHGTSQEVLKKGIGHLHESALPVGGENNHCILTGHSGLPSAKLFTDIVKMKTGDLFYLKILGDTLVYEVDQILTIDPDDTKDLLPVRGEDYVTLITCTPYGVNSHRLLVRGRRTEEGQIGSDPVEVEPCWWLDYVKIGGLILVAACVKIGRRKKKY